MASERKKYPRTPEQRERHRLQMQEYRWRFPEKVLEYEREYRKKHPRNRSSKDERARHKKDPVKWHARTTLHRKVWWGVIKKPSVCQDCGARKQKREIHGHHEDYTKPLEVIWVCIDCHWKRHKAERRARMEAARG